jgi:glutamate-1-semialdehyde aminotransferase
MFSLAFARQPVVDGNSFARVDQETWARFLRYTRDGGVLLPTRASGLAFLSHAHGVKDVEHVISTMEAVLKRMQKEDEA